MIALKAAGLSVAEPRRKYENNNPCRRLCDAALPLD